MRALAELSGAVRSLRMHMRNVIARAVVNLVNDAGATQFVQVEALSGEVRDFVERVQQYGFNSVPLAGAHPVIVLAPAGEATRVLAIAVDDMRHRPAGGEPGDVELYDNRGNRVRLLDDELRVTAVGELAITAAEGATLSVTGDCAITVSGNVQVQAGGSVQVESTDVQLGAGTLRALCDERLITYLASHVHSGVTAGGASTGAPTVAPAVGTHTTAETTAS